MKRVLLEGSFKPWKKEYSRLATRHSSVSIDIKNRYPL